MSKASKLESILGLSKPPIAISFFESPPDGVPRWEGESVAAGELADYPIPQRSA